MSIWKILAWILGSSAEKNVPQVHLPLGWSPDAQKDICLSSSSRSLWTLSELCKNRKCTWMKDKNKADCRWKQKKSIHRTEDKQRGDIKEGEKEIFTQIERHHAIIASLFQKNWKTTSYKIVLCSNLLQLTQYKGTKQKWCNAKIKEQKNKR